MGCVVWFTGLPCSGKTTLAKMVCSGLNKLGERSVLLDGDIIREKIRTTGFSEEERKKHLRYVALMAYYINECGVNAICSFVSPYEESRNFIKSVCDNVIIVYLKTPLSVCEKRDVKGMYKKSRNGEIKNFTGTDGVYEEPSEPDLILNTSILTQEECSEKILKYIGERVVK